MTITCIAASNIRHAGENSTSLRVCHSIEKILKTKAETGDIHVDIINLADADLLPCTGCGECFHQGRCVADDDFNAMYSHIAASKAVFIVSPHYAPIPAKLAMLLEKMEQTAFLRRFHDNEYTSDVYNIPAGIIAHGGATGENALRSYKHMVLDTVANALETAMMHVVGLDDEWPTGVVFPVAEVRKDKNVLFPIQVYDWHDIQIRITPLIENVLNKAV